MALPLTRDNTLIATSSEVPSALLNNLQDMIIGAKQGSVGHIIGGAEMTTAAASNTWTLDTAGVRRNQTTTDSLIVPIPSRVGTKITAVTVYGGDDSAVRFRCVLEKKSILVASAAAAKSDIGFSGLTGANQAIALTTIVEEVLAATDKWVVRIYQDAGSGDSRIYGVAVTFQVE